MGRRITGNVSASGKRKDISRKDKRKAKREEKRVKRVEYATSRGKLKANPKKKLEEAKAKKDAAEKAELAKRKRPRNTSEGKPAKRANLERSRPVFPEDQEIDYLERKLGLSKDSRNKSRLEKELTMDGFPTDIMDFIDVLDSGKSIAEFDRKAKDPSGHNPLDVFPEEEVDEAQMDEYLKSFNNPLRRTGDDEDGEEYDEEDEDALSQIPSDDEELDSDQDDTTGSQYEGTLDADKVSKQIAFLPKEDIYGRATPAPSEQGEGTGTGRRPRSRLFAGQKSENIRIRTFLNGLVNRVSDANLHPVANQVANLYRENARATVNESLVSILHAALSNDVVVMNALGTTFAALVTALCILIGDEIGAYVLEHSVLRFEKITEEDREGRIQDGGEYVVSKRGSNLAVFLSHLVTFGVASSGLVFDLLDKLSEDLTDDAVEVIIVIMSECGPKLRKDDPARLVHFIKTIQSTNTSKLGPRADAMLETIYAVKNNKANNEAVATRTKHYTKILRVLQGGKGSPLLALKASWDELKNAEERGRWWVVGGVWKDQEQSIERSRDRAALDKDFARRGGGGSLAQALARASPELLALAKKQRMNTDVRRAVFCELMTSEGVIDAYDRVAGLNLTERQQREIVYVLMRCSSASKVYNEFFEEVASHMCSMRQSFRFTLQLAFWDTFKELETMSSRKVANFAKMLAALILKQSLSFAVLKPVEFPSLGTQGSLFFALFFRTLLLHGGEGKDGARRMARALNRLGASSNFTTVSDGIQFFLRSDILQDEKLSKDDLLVKRTKIAIRILDALASARSMAEEADPFDAMDADEDELEY